MRTECRIVTTSPPPAARESEVKPTTKKSAPRKAKQRFVLIGKRGERVKSESAAVAVLDTHQNIWIDLADVPGGDMPHADAMEAAKAVRTAGKNDWRAPTDMELANLVDRSRSSPGANPILKMNPVCYWTSTPYAVNSGCAWYVAFYLGGVSASYRYCKLRVRAVRAASQ